MQNKLDRLIFEAARELLREKEEEKEKAPKEKKDKKSGSKYKKEKGSKISVGPLGAGRWKKEIGLARSRAIGDSMGLVKDLGIKTQGKGSSDIAKAASVFMQAVNGNSVMGEAFGDFSKVSVDDENDVKKTGYSVKYSDMITKRNATMYFYITLLAAENSGLLTLDKGIVIADWHYVKNPTIYPDS